MPMGFPCNSFNTANQKSLFIRLTNRVQGSFISASVACIDAASMDDSCRCVVHFESDISNSAIQTLTSHNLTTLLSPAEEWILTDKFPECTIAANFLKIKSNVQDAVKFVAELDDSTSSKADKEQRDCDHVYTAHKSCYLRLASISKLHRAQRQTRKVIKIK